jgi:hypothetical protein
VRPRLEGGFYVADRIRRVVYDHTKQIVAGVPLADMTVTPPCEFPEIDGQPANQVALCEPRDVAAAQAGTIYISEVGLRILQVTSDGIIHTVAGTGARPPSCEIVGVGGPARDAQLCEVHGMVVAPDGALYFVGGTPQIFKIGVDGTLSVIAGTGVVGFAGDGGPASQAMLSARPELALAPDGSLVVADPGNLRIRRITPDGVISTIAGTGAQGQGGDGGPATSMIGEAVSGGVSRANTLGRPGTIFEYNFGRQIGIDIAGNPASSLRVVVSPAGEVVTAFPF